MDTARNWNGLVSCLRLEPRFAMNETLSTETVIVLIAAEILVAAVNIVVDLYAGVD